ncbi:hypothetical protein MP228_010054 [Amoeboaphelidium protococcarum]|nr:hypothetical protein MP228_010054 [Amoeboaphelidium protococcarum]
MWKLFSRKPTIESEVLTELCPKDEMDTFAPLDTYFSNLKLKHFFNIDLEKLAENVPYNHRLLMTIFVQNYMRPYIEQHQGLSAGEHKTGATNGIDCSDGIFNARGCLVSSIYEVDKISGQINIRQLQKKDYLEQLTCKSGGFSRLDFSKNELQSVDLEIVKNIITQLNSQGKIKQNCQINLENNRIHGLGEYKEVVPRILRELADLPQISYININNNPFCTVDRLDFWRSLLVNDILTSKVVWINQYFLNSNGWKNLVFDELVSQKMRDVHRVYYANCN